MKKRILSSLLMGALFVASMSTFTSCKDYDDDINNLQAQIDKAALASDVTALQSTVNSAATTASSALTKAEAAATQAGANETAIAAVKAVADQNAKDVATAITNAATAQTTAEAAAAAAKTAQDSANSAIAAAAKAQASAASALENIGNIEKNYVTSTTLDSKLASLKAEILADTTSEATLAKLSGQVTSFKGSINYLYSAVTSVELLGTYSGSGSTHLGSITASGVSLSMLHGIVSQDSKFGDNETYSESTPIIAFAKGDNITNDAGLIVRVNPTNVDLTNSKIVLINSKGEVLSQVEAGIPTKYTDLITTRSTTVGAGLWKVNFHVADGVSADDFAKAITSNSKTILYAVAINNTAADTTSTVAADRYVASTWDVAPSYASYTPASTFAYMVDGKDVADIHNRWTTAGTTVCEDNTTSTTVNELAWKTPSTEKIPTPATAAITSGTSQNVTNAGTAIAANSAIKTNAEKIAYYYVVLDKDRALESSPSEWNAWSSYDITGLKTTVKAGEKLGLKINSSEANGDVIGFRVFAVNYDGTLADPDGRAFYVQVGEAANSETVKGNIVAQKADNLVAAGSDITKDSKNTVIIPLTKTLAASTSPTFGQLTVDASCDASYVKGTAKVFYRLLDKDKAATSKWEDAKFIAVSIDKPGYVIDGSTLTGTITGVNTVGAITDATVNTINVAVTKVLPTTVPDGFSWKANQLTDGTYICYVDPTNTAIGTTPVALTARDVAADNGTKDFTQAVNGVTDANYTWTIANASDKTTANKFVDDLKVTNTLNAGAYQSIVTVKKALVDNKTTHATTLNYVYPQVSCTKLAAANENLDVNLPVWTGNVIFACALAPSVQVYTWKATTLGTGTAAKDYTDYAIDYNTGTFSCNAGAESVNSIFDLIYGSNSYYKSTPTGNTKVLTGLYKTTKPLYVGTTTADYTATLTSDINGAEDYFTVTFDGSALAFTKKSGATPPTANVASTLKIKATDAFGHTETIISLPLTVRAQ